MRTAACPPLWPRRNEQKIPRSQSGCLAYGSRQTVMVMKHDLLLIVSDMSPSL